MSTATRTPTRSTKVGAAGRVLRVLLVIVLISGSVSIATGASGQSAPEFDDQSAPAFGDARPIGDDVELEDLVPDTPVVPPEQYLGKNALQSQDKCAPNRALQPPTGSAVPVSGNVIWQTRESRRMPVAFAEVCLFDRSGRLLGHSVTDKDGRFTINVAPGLTGIMAVAYTSSGDGTGEDNPSVQVYRLGAAAYERYAMQSSQRTNTTMATPPPLEVVASTDTEENYAFSVYQALVRGFYGFAEWLPEGTDLDPVVAYYPPPPQREGTKYYPVSNAITVSADDVWDWDVLQHELAHHIGTVTGMLPQFGSGVDTSHAVGANLTSGSRTLDQSMSLAWVEGWATYAAISLQQRLRVSYPVLMDIPTFGNLIYEDNSYTKTTDRGQQRTNVTSRVEFSLDTEENFTFDPLPDNEKMVARFLQSLDDFNPRERRPSALPWPVYDLVKIANGRPISDAFDAWKRLDRVQGLDSCAAANWGFAPFVASGSLDMSEKPNSLVVYPNGPGPSFPPTQLRIVFADANGGFVSSISTNVDSGAEARTPVTIEVPDSVWSSVRTEKAVSWTLWATQPNDRAKYQIRSCERDLTSNAFANLSIEPICQAGTGALSGTLTNVGDETGQYRIEVNGGEPGGVTMSAYDPLSFERVVEPGESATISVGGLDDGDYLVTVAGIADNAVGDVSARQEAQVNCTSELGEDYERRVSCLAANGRIDATLKNIYSRTAVYDVIVDGRFSRTLLIKAGATQRATVVGLADGDHSIQVTRTQIVDNNVPGASTTVVDEQFSVTCDSFFDGSELVDVRAWCEDGSGRVSIYAKNDDVAGSDFLVTSGAKAGARQAFAPANGTAMMEFKTLRDGKIEFIVTRNGIEIGRPGVNIDCS